jgi:putative transposase
VDIVPYWNTDCRKLSDNFLSNTRTGFVSPGSNECTPLFSSTVTGSWFSSKIISPLKEDLIKTYFEELNFPPAKFTNSEDTLIKTRKVRIYPKDKERIHKFFGVSRYLYNRTIEYLRGDGTVASYFTIRKIILAMPTPEWVVDYPSRIKEIAISDACMAVHQAKLKCKKTGKFQEVKFRTKKDRTQTLVITKTAVSNLFIFKNKKHRVYLNVPQPITPELDGVRLTYEDHRYFIAVPMRVPIKVPENQRLNLVALDPGVRTFITFFSPEVQGKIGESDFKRIYRICLGLDKLYSKISKAKCRQKRNMRKAAERIRWKIYNLIEDLHHKTAHFLVTHFNTVLIPTFETSQMAPKLNSKVARNMMTFAHYRFKEFLKFKAKEYSCKVIEVSEAYTSKTCSYCGKIQNIGNKKVMKCSCGAIEDRDINGARGIFLRALTATSPQGSVGKC